MAWLRTGDNAATYPKVMKTGSLPRSDERTVNEIFGWLTRCMAQCAGHGTDYVIDAGTARMLGGARTDELIRICKKVHLLTQIDDDGIVAYLIIDDPEFLHMRLKAEVDWDRQRKRDNTNPAITARVRLRDGDQCRYCGMVTFWGTNDRSSGRVGTYDHLVPGTAGTVDTMVAACKSCNSARRDDVDALTLKPAPAEPVYSTATAAYLRKHLGAVVPVTFVRPDTQPGAHAHPSATRQPARVPRTADRQPAGVRTTSEQRPATAGNANGPGTTDTETRNGAAQAESKDLVPAARSYPKAGFTGSGRDGPGRAGTGQAGSGLVGAARDGPSRGGAGRSRRSTRARPPPGVPDG